MSCTDLDEWKEVGAFQVVGPPKQKHRAGCILINSSIWMEQNSHEGESWERHSGNGLVGGQNMGSKIPEKLWEAGTY